MKSCIRPKTIATILLAPEVDARVDVAERLQVRTELVHHRTNGGRIIDCCVSNYQRIICTHSKPPSRDRLPTTFQLCTQLASARFALQSGRFHKDARAWQSRFEVTPVRN